MRKIMMRIAAAALCLFLALGLILHPVTAQAYTEEQKRQAKAWLSAHGYPPTEDGAWAAYDDWLNGQWWDEFGSPDEYFGVGEGDDEDEEDDEEEQPTAATQRSQGEGGSWSDAETLVDLMAESTAAESSAVETSPAVETESTVETAAEESPTAATQADMESIFDAVEENTQKDEKRTIPFVLGGIGAVALLLVMALVLEHRKK